MVSEYKRLTPIREDAEEYEELEKELLDLFRKEIYLPLVELINPEKNILENSLDPLIAAIS